MARLNALFQMQRKHFETSAPSGIQLAFGRRISAAPEHNDIRQLVTPFLSTPMSICHPGAPVTANFYRISHLRFGIQASEFNIVHLHMTQQGLNKILDTPEIIKKKL